MEVGIDHQILHKNSLFLFWALNGSFRLHLAFGSSGVKQGAGIHCLAEIPPSTVNTVPVIHLASVEHKYETAPDISSGVPILLNGKEASSNFLAFSSCKYGSIIGL